ncbi:MULTISPECIES: Flp family type IVb pilin [Cupriavidus]|jgi:Flp pilus assembly pilin Flp|uniref:Pilus assembly protein n=1 Tax=Cupriavidus pauculus TaxID=82633 RepID=A0A5P2H4P9_9BURK|nr:pilus assembly protein [Cupriavidus pauculus]QET02982.1 pilus assembly protein [Cupriavidus pauculus]
MKFAQLRRKFRQAGQGMTEYIIIVALIAVSAIGVYAMFGQTIRNQTAALASEMSGKTDESQNNINRAGESSGQATSKANQGKGLNNFNVGNDTGK